MGACRRRALDGACDDQLRDDQLRDDQLRDDQLRDEPDRAVAVRRSEEPRPPAPGSGLRHCPRAPLARLLERFDHPLAEQDRASVGLHLQRQ